MRFLTTQALILVCSAMCINTLCANAAGAESVTYDYRGNNFVELQGEPGIFSTNDRVTGRFTLDCGAAHIEGTCANLPYENYFALGAVELGSLSFSAGPATLPTDGGDVEIHAFYFSTDASGQIFDWDIDLYLDDPSGVINVDTDNNIHGPIDSAAALGGGAVVFNDQGKWKTIGRHGKGSIPVFKDHNRTYGSWAGGGHCQYLANLIRCWDIQAQEHYDVHGTFEYVEVGVQNYFHRYYPATGNWTENLRFLSCPVDQSAISAHPNRVTIDATLDANSPGCYSYGNRTTYDAANDEYQHSPYEFYGLTAISGEWTDPLTTGKAVTNRWDKHYDPFSGTTNETTQHCNENWGDMMGKGGFSVSGEAPFSQTSHLFEGYDPSGWSNFNVVRCNDGNKMH